MLLGRPHSKMWCPYVIGRDSWVRVKQKALYKRIPPNGGGGPDWNGATHREDSTGGVRA